MNKVILIGRLTKDPELRYTAATGKAVSSFTLAVDKKIASKGEEKSADFLPVVTWNKLAEFCSNYFKKGRKVAILGRVQTRSWQDSNGAMRYTTEIVADEAYFADSKRPSDNGSSKANANTGSDAKVLTAV